MGGLRQTRPSLALPRPHASSKGCVSKARVGGGLRANRRTLPPGHRAGLLACVPACPRLGSLALTLARETSGDPASIPCPARRGAQTPARREATATGLLGDPFSSSGLHTNKHTVAARGQGHDGIQQGLRVPRVPPHLSGRPLPPGPQALDAFAGHLHFIVIGTSSLSVPRESPAQAPRSPLPEEEAEGNPQSAHREE